MELSEEEAVIYSNLLTEVEPIPVAQFLAKVKEINIDYPLRTIKQLLERDLIVLDKSNKSLQARF